MQNNGCNIYKNGRAQMVYVLTNFFGRVRILRERRKMGRGDIIKNMRAMGATIGADSLATYETRPDQKGISLAYMLLFCEYFNVSFEAMVQPLTDAEFKELEGYKAKGRALIYSTARARK